MSEPNDTHREFITPDTLRDVVEMYGERRIACDDLLRNAAFTIEALTARATAAEQALARVREVFAELVAKAERYEPDERGWAGRVIWDNLADVDLDKLDAVITANLPATGGAERQGTERGGDDGK